MSQVKTGASPSFKAQTDLSRVIPALGASVGITDIGEAIEFYKKHRAAIQAVLSFFKGLFGGKSKAPEAVPGPATPEPTPVPTPAPPPPGARRIPTSLHSEMTLVEDKKRPREAGGGRTNIGPDSGSIADRQRFGEIREGSSPARRGARIHIDTTPRDQFGAWKPGGEENASLLHDPEGDSERTPNHRIEHIVTGDGELTSEYDDYGCTPVILIPWEEAPGRPFPIDTGKRWSMSYQARYHAPDGSTRDGNVVRWVAEE